MSDEPKIEDEEVKSLLLEHDEEEVVNELAEVEEYVEPPFSQDELIEIRWMLFGKCPHCHEVVKDWSPGPFNAKHYRSLQDDGIDALSGHRQSCSYKWLKA